MPYYACGILYAAVSFPEIQNDDVDARLQEVAATAERMCGALGLAVGMLFHGDPRLCPNLETVLTLLGQSMDQLDDWCYSIAFEEALQVFAYVRVHHPNMNLWPLVRTMPRGREPRQFFEEVSEDVEYAARACDLQWIIKRVSKADEAIANQMTRSAVSL